MNPSMRGCVLHEEIPMKFAVHLSLLSLGISHAALADSLPLYQGDDVVVTATRSPQYLKNVLSDVTVITRDQIAKSGQTSLVQLLQTAGGLEVAANGGPGQPSSVFLRGTNSNQVLVLLDGVRIGSATAGTAAFENIPLDQIDHVEILRGPASSLYGADAVGGVIQIFTRKGSGNIHPDGSIGYGSYDTSAASAGIGGASGPVRFHVQAGYTATEGFSATNPKAGAYIYNPDRDPYRNTNAGAQFSYEFQPGQEAGLEAFQSDGTTHFDSGPNTDDVNRHRNSAYAVYSRNRLTEGWQSLVRLGQGIDDYQVIQGAYPGRYRTVQTQFTWQNDVSVPGGNLTLGLEHLNQRVASSTQYTQTSRNVNSAFGGYAAQFGKHTIQLNLRRDDNSQFGAESTGSLGYGYRFMPAWRFVGSVGTAFKAPTFNDLYWPLSYGYSGNPNLKPERSRNYEAGLRFDQAGQRFKAIYFDNHISDLIAINSTYTTVENIANARIRGLEIGYHGELMGLEWGADATFQQPEDADTGKLLARRAEQYGSLSLAKTVAGWRLGGEMIVSGRRYDSSSNNPASRMGGYAVYNLTASRPLTRDLSLVARWNNIFDREYTLVQGYNTPGSNLFVSLRYQPR